MDQIATILNTPDDQLTDEQLQAKAALISMATSNMKQANETKCAELKAKGDQLLAQRKTLRVEIQGLKGDDDITSLDALTKEKKEITDKIKEFIKENPQVNYPSHSLIRFLTLSSLGHCVCGSWKVREGSA